MKKAIKYLVWVTCLLISFSSYAQQIVFVEEAYGLKGETMARANNQIVDINSTLKLRISKDSLRKKLSADYPELMGQIALEAEIEKLNTALKDQAVILEGLRTRVITANSRSAFYTAANDFINYVSDPANGLDITVNELFQEYRATYPNIREAPVKSLEFVYLNLDMKLQQAKDDLSKVKKENIMISVAGFKKNPTGGGRVHIENFDTGSDLDYVTIPRWVTSLSESQKDKLEAMSDTAANNKVTLESIFKGLKDQFKKYYPDISCLGTLKTELTKIPLSGLADAVKQDLQNAANDILSGLEGIETLSATLKKDVSEWDISTVLNLISAVNSIIDSVRNTDVSVTDLINKSTAVAQVQQWVGSFKTEFDSCKKSLTSDFENIKQVLALMTNQSKNYLANDEIGEEVLSFQISNLPTEGTLNLKGTGSRSNGDEIVIKVVLRPDTSNGDDNNDTFSQPITLETTRLVMQLVGAYSRVVVGMVFADPFTSDATVADPSKKHFFTPSASLVLKFGSRKSNFYNEFVDFGIGLNFASPDFDLDGNPEFGTGVIATALKDILSVGINYNVSKDAFYWFFGVNLPFNIPGIPVNTIQTSNE